MWNSVRIKFRHGVEPTTFMGCAIQSDSMMQHDLWKVSGSPQQPYRLWKCGEKLSSQSRLFQFPIRNQETVRGRNFESICFIHVSAKLSKLWIVNFVLENLQKIGKSTSYWEGCSKFADGLFPFLLNEWRNSERKNAIKRFFKLLMSGAWDSLQSHLFRHYLLNQLEREGWRNEKMPQLP